MSAKPVNPFETSEQSLSLLSHHGPNLTKQLHFKPLSRKLIGLNATQC